jgi:hypothetical protein
MFKKIKIIGLSLTLGLVIVALNVHFSCAVLEDEGAKHVEKNINQDDAELTFFQKLWATTEAFVYYKNDGGLYDDLPGHLQRGLLAATSDDVIEDEGDDEDGDEAEEFADQDSPENLPSEFSLGLLFQAAHEFCDMVYLKQYE